MAKENMPQRAYIRVKEYLNPSRKLACVAHQKQHTPESNLGTRVTISA
jgi:hypothetical protein